MPLSPITAEILSELFSAHQRIDQLQQRVQQLEQTRTEYDHELGERSRVNLELRDRIAELEAQLKERDNDLGTVVVDGEPVRMYLETPTSGEWPGSSSPFAGRHPGDHCSPEFFERCVREQHDINNGGRAIREVPTSG